MADLRVQMEEIKALLLSEKNKASAYLKLLHLQEMSAVEPSSVQIFADSSHVILASLVDDIFENDEEIASQALKCLGFMIYHPTIVASIGGDDVNAIIETLVKVIVTTKIKSVCNLGMWCISIQQFRASLLDQHIHSLLRAIIHALDNPIGSLSTTFEAMQAVVKLTSSLAEQMRNTSSVWTPPIYKRLVSVDKRNRDMSERCLLKIMPAICPPPVTLSKALAIDLKKKLLSAMKELLDQGMKIQSLQAWGWFIRLLGPYTMKNKHTVNEMLKLLEKTFSDTDSQVQIASLVAWEGLIDAFIQPRIQDSHINSVVGHEAQVLETSEVHNTQTEVEKQLKRLKLIMSPLIGIMSSKCDVSVHASCLSAWAYLLHKLEDSVSCHSVIKTVWEPMIEVVFRVGPNNKNIWFFNFCVDLLDALILGKKQGTPKLHDMETRPLSLKNTMVIGPTSEKCPLRHYPINCSPWKLCQMDFFIKMTDILVNREANATITPEYGRLADAAARRLFGSLLEAFQKALRSVSITYDEVMQSLNTIFRFLNKLCKNATLKDCNNYSSHARLKFLEVVTDKLNPSILESPLYKVGLDREFVKNFACDTETRSSTFPGICCMDSEEKVLPVVYLCTLYFSVFINSSVKESQYESSLQQMQGYVKFLLSSFFSEEVLRVFFSLLYKSTTFNRLQIWVVLASCIKDCIDTEKLKLEMENNVYSLVLHLLAYPLASWSFSPINHELQNVVEAWKSLFLSLYQASVHCSVKSFSEDLCALLNGCIDQNTPTVGTGVELQLKENNYNGEFVLLYGGVIICVLEQMTLTISSIESHNVDCGGGKSNINNCMELAARFVKLLWETKKRIEPFFVSIATRFLSELVNFVGCLHQKQDILILIENMSSPLLQWLSVSDIHLLDEKTNYQLQILWSEILKALQSRSPLKFDSSFLKLQAPLLEKTLGHQNISISEPTINFWNSTYGKQFKLEFPQNLLPVLDKLSRNGKINLFSRYKIPTTLKKCSKRVEILGNPVNGSDDLNLNAKRKRADLTEHQKEVRRAQQGRAMDCSGRGPGIRTYTNVDFSQGNEESQDSQDIRDAESILEMLKKVH